MEETRLSRFVDDRLFSVENSSEPMDQLLELVREFKFSQVKIKITAHFYISENQLENTI